MLNEQLISQPRPLADRAHDALLRRSRLLLPPDRALVELTLQQQLPVCQIARLLGLHPGSVSRRATRLIRRLRSPIVVGLIDSGRKQLPDELWQVGIGHFVQHRTLRELADHHQISMYRVRTMIEQLRGWARSYRRGI